MNSQRQRFLPEAEDEGAAYWDGVGRELLVLQRLGSFCICIMFVVKAVFPRVEVLAPLPPCGPL